ncbi:MAG: FAD:protein FMN transferase [Bacteroidales bacterium]|nr:FAD:protein FMN transferase [Bacteroidales bacterium]
MKAIRTIVKGLLALVVWGVLGFAGILLTGCQRQEYTVFSGYAQGGVWQVKCDLEGVRVSPAQVHEALDSLLHLVDASLSGYNKNSVLSRHMRGELASPDGENGATDDPQLRLFREAVGLAEKVWGLTGGKVDASAAALFDAWGFGFKNDSLPSPQRVDSLKALGGYFFLTRPDGTPQRFNFNAFAQGLSCDLLARYLEEIGVRNMMVNVGGEIYCRGLNPKGKAWTLGIDTPSDGNEEPGASVIRVFSLPEQPCGVVTSGNYRKFYVKNGVKYTHTINPQSGYPVAHTLCSATVIVGENCPLTAPGADFEGWPTLLSDALATYCMVVGEETARYFVEATPGLEACLVCAEDSAEMADASASAGSGKASAARFCVWASEGF